MTAAAIVMAAAAAPAQAPPRAAGAAGAEYRVELDPWVRPEMGVVGLTTAGRLALAGFDVLAATWEGRCREPSLWCGAARAFELVLIDLPVAHYAQMLPHELFGHGGRAGLLPGRTYGREVDAGLSFGVMWDAGGAARSSAVH